MNKIGSLANGPILGVFLLGILTKKATGPGAITGLVLGFITNTIFWIYVPSVSWPWWNMIGCVICFAFGYLISMSAKIDEEKLQYTYYNFREDSKDDFKIDWRKYYYILAGWGVIITVICVAL